MTRRPASSLLLTTLAATLLAGSLAGCAPLILGAAAGTALMASDRRTSGAQIDDEAIELRVASRLREAFGDRVHINANSYNRQVLLTGEVPSEAVRQQAEQIAGRVDNVRGLVNELAVMSLRTLSQSSSDVLTTAKVRASFVDASDLQANAFKVVTERGTVYLMGRVTAREAERATQIARQINGVQRVVRIFEVVSPEEMRLQSSPPPSGAPAMVAPAAAPAVAPQQPPTGAVSTPVR